MNMHIRPIKTRVFKEGESLLSFTLQHIKTLKENSIIVFTSKIVALSEYRTAPIGDEKEKEILIHAESQWAIKTKWVWLTLKDHMIMASAGIDESNANGKLILLPEDSFMTAKLLRKKLKSKYKIKNLGVIITDSRTIPLRAGVIGVALGYAGFESLKDYRGKPDIFGRKFIFSQTNLADSLATAAVLVMGEGSEQQPLAIMKNPPVVFSQKEINKMELVIPLEDDLYRPFFVSSRKSKFKNLL